MLLQVYPRVNNFSILILSLSYLFLILSLISEFGGGTGWTLYPPLSTSFMSLSPSSTGNLIFGKGKKNLSEEDKDMIVNEISLVIQNIILETTGDKLFIILINGCFAFLFLFQIQDCWTVTRAGCQSITSNLDQKVKQKTREKLCDPKN